MASEEKAHKAHVLVLPYPAQGHINPMLQFSKRLVARGLRVTLATTVYLAATTTLHPSAAAIAVETISDGFDHGGYAQAKSSEEYLAQFRTTGPQTLTQLITRLNSSGPRVDVLIYDGFLPWALDVAQQFGLVGAVFFTQSCAVNNIYWHVYEGLIRLPLSEGRPLLVPGLPPLEPWESPSFVSDYGSYPGFSETVVNQFSNIEKADWVLVNSFYKLEEEVVDWMAKKWKVMTIGPTLPSMYLDKQLQDDTDYGLSLFKPETASCLNWLSTKPTKSVVYVSFGSMAELETEQVEEIAWALNETTYNFLWIVRASEKSKLPENFSDGPSEKGLVVTWSPQLKVLSHESVGCFVTHCGFNSVLEAVSLGVPVVGVPVWTDQGTNAKYVRGENLRKCINEVMGGQRAEEIKRNVVKWKGLAKEAIGEGGSSDKNIDEFVAGLGQFVSGGSF